MDGDRKSPTDTALLPLHTKASIQTSEGSYHRFVFSDPVALRYLEEDVSTVTLERRGTLEGYECYVVEQWACSRKDPTFIVTAYTGETSQSIKVGVLGVPKNEDLWSPRLKIYFQSLHQYHARRRETPLGTILVMNLSSFPSSLNVVYVPEGDVFGHREEFVANEDLKRLGCSGRVGLTLAYPTSATQAKFHQLFMTSDKIPLYSSVIELVKLCQVALMLFGKLEPEFADGLLCDVTERSINDWWLDFGGEYYNIEPHDGILGPTTVAGLLGLLVGARNRLHAYGAPVAKDVFEVEDTKRGISYFQKAQQLRKTRRLDRQTLERLHIVTAKAASNEGWTMPRAVKSTVAELSGKGGELAMDVVTARDKAGIADIETVDIDRFTQLVQGERAKWLWYGKPRKSPFQERSSGTAAEIGMEGSKFEAEDISVGRLGEPPTIEDKDQLASKISSKLSLGRATDGRSGFDRIKDAVGRRSHAVRMPLDGQTGHGEDKIISSNHFHGRKRNLKLDNTQQAVGGSEGSRKIASRQMGYDHSQGVLRDEIGESTEDDSSHSGAEPLSVTDEPLSNLKKTPVLRDSSKQSTREPSLVLSVDGTEGLPVSQYSSDETRPDKLLFRRTHSYSALDAAPKSTSKDDWWPRNLSFSIAEDSVLLWRPLIDIQARDATLDPDQVGQPFRAELFMQDFSRKWSKIELVEKQISEWVDRQIEKVGGLDNKVEQNLQQLNDLYYPALEDFQKYRTDAEGALSHSKEELQISLRDVETLSARLEYEFNSLRSKVEDVEEGVAEFERQVLLVQDRFREVVKPTEEAKGWSSWLSRLLKGRTSNQWNPPSEATM